MNRFHAAVRQACGLLDARQRYARNVLQGYQSWSGADLKGTARKWGAGYAGQRRYAMNAWVKAGGIILADRRTGRLFGAVYVGQDDFGDPIYLSHHGIVFRSEIR